MIPRLIPCLTLVNGQMYRTKNFKKPTYVGDPINAVRIFNEKGADELAIFDIGKEKLLHTQGHLKALKSITDQAFMPTSYGGGVRHVDDVKKAFDVGFDKIILSKTLLQTNNWPSVIEAAAKIYGSQSVSFALDVYHMPVMGWQVRGRPRRFGGMAEVLALAETIVASGAGEIMVRDVAKDGHNQGVNEMLVSAVSSQLAVPVVAVGGVYDIAHVRAAMTAGAQSVACGNWLTYQGRRQAVLINYPARDVLDDLFGVKL